MYAGLIAVRNGSRTDRRLRVGSGRSAAWGLRLLHWRIDDLMASKAKNIGEGTVLAIPLGDGRWTLSQVYRPGIVFFLLVFDQVSDGLPDNPSITTRPVLGSWTNDAEVHRGNWKLLCHLPVAAGIFKEPEYTVLRGGQPVVESFDGQSFRPKTGRDGSLKNRKSRSPLLVEDATRAFLGLKEWIPYYEEMALSPRV